jgi:hypothetical protein
MGADPEVMQIEDGFLREVEPTSKIKLGFCSYLAEGLSHPFVPSTMCEDARIG